jgi:RNA polymerase sigma-70 factor (ECF subfamily)
VEDHVQEVFLRFFRDLPNVRNPEAVRSFIVGITVRVARNEVRQRAIRNRLTPWLERWPTLQQGSAHEIANSSGGARQPFDSIDGYCLDSLDWNDHEPVWRLQAILEQLGPQPRLVFVLRYVRQLELTDVAAALGLSLSTVKRQLKRANRQVYALAKSDPLLAKYIPRQDDD